MEPVTYLIGVGSAVLGYAYFIKNKEILSGPTIYEKYSKCYYQKLVEQEGLNVQKLDFLKNQRNILDEILEREQEKWREEGSVD